MIATSMPLILPTVTKSDVAPYGVCCFIFFASSRMSGVPIPLPPMIPIFAIV